MQRVFGNILLIVLFTTCTSYVPKSDLEEKLDLIKLPEGFSIELYADNLPNARSMALSKSGVLFVGSRKKDKVYALTDTDKDGHPDQTLVIASGLNSPNGVAIKGNDLFVAEINRILKFKNAGTNPRPEMKFEVIYDGYPLDRLHGWKYITFGPDGLLYVPVGAPCNICESKDIFATITRLDVDADHPEPFIVHRGIRNTVGITFHPESGEMWFTDNGRDWMGDELPACELNYAPEENMHFGFPYFHQGDLPDPEWGVGKKSEEYSAPFQKLGPHVAPLGLKFKTGTQFPESYDDHVLIAEHGSWNRSTPLGYRISIVDTRNKGGNNYGIFAEGWLQNGTAWGRPVDLIFNEDGSLLVSDDLAGAIYRISYSR